MIKPTVGRVVHFRPCVIEGLSNDGSQPLAAIIAYVWNDRLVNLTVLDQHGSGYARTSVQLLQDGDTPNGGSYAEWMPYQVGQAAKTEALQAQLEGEKA